MRSLLFSVTVCLAALGIVATTPDVAKAYWPASMTGYRYHGFGTMSTFGVPLVRWQNSSSGLTQSIYSPGGFRSTDSPFGVMRLWYGPSTTTITFNSSTGISSTMTNRSVTGYAYSPYAGFSKISVSGNTTASSLSTLLAQGYKFPTTGNVVGIGTWRGMSYSLMIVPVPGAGTYFTSPLLNWNAAANLSGAVIGMCPSVLATRALNTMFFGSLSSTAAIYSDYLPPGYIK